MAERPPSKPKASTSICPSCGGPRPGQFCANCGEKVVDPKELGLFHFIAQAVAGLTTLDGKVISSLRCLIFRPGELTHSWVRGARVKHLRPVQLFLLLNLVVVLIDRWFGLHGINSESLADSVRAWEDAMRQQANDLGMTYSDYEVLYKAKSSAISRSTVLVLVPIVALISFLFNAWKERRLGVHLVFGLHAVAFYLVVPDFVMSLMSPRWIKEALSPLSEELHFWLFEVVVLLPFAVFGIWWYFGCRRVFGGGRVFALIQSLLFPIFFLLFGLVAHQYVTLRLTLRALAE